MMNPAQATEWVSRLKVDALRYGHSIVLLQRHLCRTNNDYLGIVLTSVTAGDEIWLLQNATAPFALRLVPGAEAGR